ncbi:MAG: DUF3995 domain-containing protein [Bacteroidota bacterium]
MIPLLAVLLCTVFCLLGILHFYWAAGGEWALADAMTPTMKASINTPSRQVSFRILTVIVGVGLVLMGYLMLANWRGYLPEWLAPILPWATLAVAGIFTIRAIGDFREVGLFQGEPVSEFSRRDKRIYSPLCVGLALGAYLLWWGA